MNLLLRNYSNVINKYMTKNNISRNLKVKVTNYIKYMVKEEENHYAEEANEILAKLPNSLQETLATEAFGKILNKIPMLRDNFSSSTLLKTLKIFKEAKFSPGDIVFWVKIH